jgi:site-specific recombinase XerD
MEYKKAVRKLYTDYLESKKEDFNGEKLCDFFSLTVNVSHTDPDRLPTPDIVRALVESATKSRDKALIMTLWSSAGRIGEILGLQWKDVKFDSSIAKVRFRETKTGGSRTVPLRAGFVYLKELKEKDSRSNEQDAFVFRSFYQDTQLSHTGACKVIKRAREKTDIPDRIKTNPHAFRKGRATYLAARGMNQAQLCEFGGWAQGSSHVAKYIRMAESDVENSIKKIAGLRDSDKELEEDLNPIKCHDCNALNKFEAINCNQCGEAISMEEQFIESQIEEKTDQFMEEVIRSQTEFKPKEINEKAKEFVNEEFNLS